MPREPRGEADGPINGRALQLLPADEIEAALITMFRIYRVFVTADVLNTYREILGSHSAARIREACKVWMRQPPENRHAYPHELVTLVDRLTTQEQPRSDPAPEMTEEERRATLAAVRPLLDAFLGEHTIPPVENDAAAVQERKHTMVTEAKKRGLL